MKEFLLKLTGVMLCAAILHSAAADRAMPLQTKQVEELHAAVTDMPDIIDMSNADPRTWHSLPPAAQVNDQVLVHEGNSQSYLIGRTRPF
jgi:hypothetical protein